MVIKTPSKQRFEQYNGRTRNYKDRSSCLKDSSFYQPSAAEHKSEMSIFHIFQSIAILLMPRVREIEVSLREIPANNIFHVVQTFS